MDFVNISHKQFPPPRHTELSVAQGQKVGLKCRQEDISL